MTIEELHADMKDRFDNLEETISGHIEDDRETFDKHRDAIEEIKRRLAYLAGAAGVAIFIIQPLLKRIIGE